MGLTGRLCIRFQTITSEYDQGEAAAGAARGKHCGDAGLAQCCQLPPAAQRCAATSSTKGPRRRGFATWQRQALRLQTSYVSTAAHPVANVWRSIPVQPRVKKDL